MNLPQHFRWTRVWICEAKGGQVSSGLFLLALLPGLRCVGCWRQLQTSAAFLHHRCMKRSAKNLRCHLSAQWDCLQYRDVPSLLATHMTTAQWCFLVPRQLPNRTSQHHAVLGLAKSVQRHQHLRPGLVRRRECDPRYMRELPLILLAVFEGPVDPGGHSASKRPKRRIRRHPRRQNRCQILESYLDQNQERFWSSVLSQSWLHCWLHWLCSITFAMSHPDLGLANLLQEKGSCRHHRHHPKHPLLG